MRGLKFRLITAICILISITSSLSAITIEEYTNEYLYCFDDLTDDSLVDFFGDNLDTVLSINIDAYYKSIKEGDTIAVYSIGKRMITKFFVHKQDLGLFENFINIHLSFIKGTSYEANTYLNLSYGYYYFNLREQDIFYSQEAYRVAKMNNDTSTILKSLAYLCFIFEDIKDRKNTLNILRNEICNYEPTLTYNYKDLEFYWYVYQFNLRFNVGTDRFDEELNILEKKPYLSYFPEVTRLEIKLIKTRNDIIVGKKDLNIEFEKLVKEVKSPSLSWTHQEYLKNKLFNLILETPLALFTKEKWNSLLTNLLVDVKKMHYIKKLEHLELLVSKHLALGNTHTALSLSRELNQIYRLADQNKSSKLITSRVDLFNKLENLKVKLKVTELKNVQLNKTVTWTVFCIFLLVFISIILFSFYRYHLKVESKLKDFNMDLELKNKNIDSKNRILEQFSFTIAHDFAEPIRSIKNTLTFIKSGSLSKTETDEVIEFSFKSIGFLNNLINDFLLYTKSCHLNSNRKYQPLTNAIELAKINLSDYTFDLVAPTNLPQMKYNQSDIVSVFQNLIKNAVKYCPADRKSVIELEVLNSENWHQIKIKDNGFGIPEDKLTSIFSPFSRLQPKGTVKGSGLGLSIVQNIIDKYNGYIIASNNEGVGATFTINLPSHLFEDDIRNVSNKATATTYIS